MSMNVWMSNENMKYEWLNMRILSNLRISTRSDDMIMKFKHVRMSNENLFIVHNNTNDFEFYVLFKKTLNYEHDI